MSDREQPIANFRLPDDMDGRAFEAKLAKARAFEAEEPVIQEWRVHDSFDWRLFKQSMILRRSGSRFRLASLNGGTAEECEAFLGPPIFSWDLPDGDLKDALRPILKVRALLEVARVTLTRTTLRVLNTDRKTVVRLVVTEVRRGSESGPPLATYLSLRGVRGYNGHARRLRKAVISQSPIDSLDRAIYNDALTAAGKSPESYASSLEYELDPKQPAGDAARTIFLSLLQKIRINESGIKDDIDTEFLHEYRVAIRRTRAALSQLKGVFTESSTEQFKQVFRALGRNTNELRDLDVHLLAEADYNGMLPAALRECISPVFDLLRSRRRSTLEKVVRSLNDPSYHQTLDAWESFLNSPPEDESNAPQATVPISKLARQRIYKRYRRIVRDGNYILEHMEDELLHELRLQCKKLRYLLEFFACLFPRKRMRRLIKQLKVLQENLGEFTDFAVQQEWLLDISPQLPDSDPRTRKALVASGALIENLERRQSSVKAEFAKVFSRFAAPKNQRTYQELFGPGKKRKKGKKRRPAA